MSASARRSLLAPLALVVALVAAVGLVEGVLDVSSVGTPAERRRAGALLVYAAATWVVPFFVVTTLGALVTRLVRPRIDGHVALAVGLVAWTAAAAWTAGLAWFVGVLGGLVVGALARFVLSRVGDAAVRRAAFGAWLVVLVGGAVGAWRLAAPAEVAPIDAVSAPRAPIVVVNVDTLRRDALSAYGGAPTPHLDRVGEQGWTIDDAIVPSSWTLPSVTSLWTSRLPRDHGVDALDATLPDDAPLLAEHLADAGYTTVAVLANPILATDRGFTRGFDVVEDHTHVVEKNLFWVIRALQRLADLGLRAVDGSPSSRKLPLPSFDLRHGATIRHTGYLAADEVTDAAIEWIDRAAGAELFLYVHYYDPHDPYLPHPSELLHRDPAFDAAHLDEHVDLYRGEVAFLDAQLGRLLDALEERGLLARALVVVTSDHGEEFLDHGGWFHGHTLYDELVRVPLLVRFPDGVDPGPAPREASVLDVTPTILDVVGAEPLPGAEGRSLLTDRTPRPRLAERTDEERWTLALRDEGLHWIVGLPPALGVTTAELETLASRVEAPVAPLRRWTFDAGLDTFAGPARDGASWVDGALVVDARLGPPLATRAFTTDDDGLLGVAFDAVSSGDGERRLAVRLDRRESETWTPVETRLVVPRQRPAPLVVRTRRGETWRLVVKPADTLDADQRWTLDDVVVAVDDPRVVLDLQAYDVAADPAQRHDVADEASHADAARTALTQLLERAIAPARSSTRELDADEVERLRALGYIK